MATAAELIEEIKKMSVLELSELIKALEEEFGVSATAVAAAAPAAAAAGDGAAAEEESSTVDVVLTARRRQEDPGDQGRARRHRPGPQGGQGTRGRGAEAHQGGHRARRGREAQGRARGGRRERRAEVARRRQASPRGAADERPLVVLRSIARRAAGARHRLRRDRRGRRLRHPPSQRQRWLPDRRLRRARPPRHRRPGRDSTCRRAAAALAAAFLAGSLAIDVDHVPLALAAEHPTGADDPRPDAHACSFQRCWPPPVGGAARGSASAPTSRATSSAVPASRCCGR